MCLKKILVEFLILQLIARTCLAEIIIETSKSKDSSDLIEVAVRVLKSCHDTRVKAIGVVGNSPDSLIAPLSSGEHFPAVLIDNTKQSVESGPVSRMSRYKLQIFVIVASSSTKFRAILVDIKKSRWWNHMAHFYIIDLPAKENGCTRAFEFLWAAWRMNLLEAKFMCTDRSKGRLVYSFNPYTTDAPDPWKLEKIYRGENNHRWTLLVREYREDDGLCRHMDFEKTKNLGRYEIRVTAKESVHMSIDMNKAGMDALGGETPGIFRTVFNSLNATVKLLIHRRNGTFGSVDNEGKANGPLADMYKGISDIGLNDRNVPGVTKLTWTYPHYYTGISAMTQYSGNESQLNKIVSLIDRSSQIGLCLVSVVTVIFLKYVLDQTPMKAALNTLRLFCNSCLTKVPIYPASRIYLASLFFFMVTIQGIYQGKLASLLSKRVLHPNVDTMQDLAESSHTIYCDEKSYARYFDYPAFEGRFVEIEDHDCTEYVLRDSLAACVVSRNSIIRKAARFKLHLSRDLIVKFPLTWVIREDWPLERRINIKIRKLFEANLFQYSYERAIRQPLRDIKANDNENRDRNYKVFNLDDLTFAFAILGIGLVLSTVCFIAEVMIRRVVFWRITKAVKHFFTRIVKAVGQAVRRFRNRFE